MSFVRPPVLGGVAEGIEVAADHAAAARAAFAHGRPVLLTTGAKNLMPYAEQSRLNRLPLVARVLDHPDSLAACRRAGIPPHDVIAGRGPFSIEENRRHIRHFHIGVLVTKDSGQAGGTDAKLEAARAEDCRVVVVRRPAHPDEHSFADIDTLLAALDRMVEKEGTIESCIATGTRAHETSPISREKTLELFHNQPRNQ